MYLYIIGRINNPTEKPKLDLIPFKDHHLNQGEDYFLPKFCYQKVKPSIAIQLSPSLFRDWKSVCTQYSVYVGH